MYDIVVFGATSFVGRILVRYLLDRHGAAGQVRWAIAGRSASRLEALKTEFGASGLPTIVVDAADVEGLRRMCADTRVVISTVGPYALHGEPLVAACAATGTDYCDLTGEVQWIRRMVLRHEAAARASGARIVNCCGFDSIPSDLGVQVLQREAVQRFGQPLERVRLRVKAMRGGASGGTVASLLNVVKEVRQDPSLRAELANPYSLCVGVEPLATRQPNVSGAVFDEAFGSWSAPFVMAGINTRIVHRSNALGGYPYGRDFRYDEGMLTGRGLRGRLAAMGTTLGLGAFMVGAALGPVRGLLERFVLPKPGEGPSPAAQASGFFDLRLHGTTADGRALRGKVTGDRDPGYGSTAKMLGEAAACLAFDLPKGALPGGLYTPASALGERLVPRLEAHAGLRFTVEGIDPAG